MPHDKTTIYFEVLGGIMYFAAFASSIFLLVSGRWVNVLIGIVILLLSSTINTIVLLPGHLLHRRLILKSDVASKRLSIPIIFLLGWTLNICLVFGSTFILFAYTSSQIKPGIYIPSYLLALFVTTNRWFHIAEFERRKTGARNKATDSSVIALSLALIILAVAIVIGIGSLGVALYAAVAIGTIVYEFKLGYKGFTELRHTRERLMNNINKLRDALRYEGDLKCYELISFLQNSGPMPLSEIQNSLMVGHGRLMRLIEMLLSDKVLAKNNRNWYLIQKYKTSDVAQYSRLLEFIDSLILTYPKIKASDIPIELHIYGIVQARLEHLTSTGQFSEVDKKGFRWNKNY